MDSGWWSAKLRTGVIESRETDSTLRRYQCGYTAAVRWLGILAILAGCGPAVPSAPPSEALSFFPHHASPLGTGDAALLQGIPTFEDGCLWIEAADGTRYLALWPRDVIAGMIGGQPAILTSEQELLVETGSEAQLGGSEAADRTTAEELVGPIPEPCAGGAFWVVGDVLNHP